MRTIRCLVGPLVGGVVGGAIWMVFRAQPAQEPATIRSAGGLPQTDTTPPASS